MRLEQDQSGEQTNPTASDGALAQRLTQDELAEVLNVAIERQAEGQQYGGDSTTVEEAVEIARQLGIPEDQVLAAAQDLQGRRLQRLDEAKQIRLRGEIKAKRKKGFFISLLPIGGAAAVLAYFSPLLALAVLPFFLFALWRFLAPVADDDLRLEEPPPKPGACRVCGRPATTPRSTFCEEHRWQGPSAQT